MKSTKIYAYCLFAAFFSCAVVHATQGAMLTSYIEEYKLLASAQGSVASSQSIGQALSLFIMFWIAGRVSKSTIVTIAFTIITVMLCFISFVPPFVVLCMLYFVIGLAFGSISTGTSALIPDMFEGANATKYMARLHGAFGLGGLVSPLFYKFLFDSGYGWNIIIRITMFVLAALLITYCFLARYSHKSLRLATTSNQKIKLKDVKSFLKSGSGVLLIFSVFFYATHQSIIAVWMIRYVEVFLEGPELAPITLSLFWGGIVISRFFVHKLPFSPVKIVMVGNFVASLVLFTGVMSGSPMVMTICSPIVGLLGGPTIPVILAVGCAENKGNTILPTNLLNLAMFLAQAIGPPLVGALVHSQPMSAGIFLSTGAALTCSIFVFAYFKGVGRRE